MRTIAFDDGFFKPRKKGKALLVGVLSRLDNRVEGILSTTINVDGFDSTKKILRLLKETRFGEQAQFILLSGLNFAGFNMVDVKQLFKKTKKPVIIVFRKKPNLKKFFLAIKKAFLVKPDFCFCKNGRILPFGKIARLAKTGTSKTAFCFAKGWRKAGTSKKTKSAMKRWQLVLNAGRICESGNIHFQAIGIREKAAAQLIKRLCVNSNLPEPIRLAHLVASGISLGESTRP